MSAIEHRHDFVFLFDVTNGNPNGDPDAGNLPRLDPETSRGLVTDVCLKRKIRNYVQMTKEEQSPWRIYVKEKAVLGRFHKEAYQEHGIELGDDIRTKLSPLQYELLQEHTLPEGLSGEEGDEEDGYFLVISQDCDNKEIKKWVKAEVRDKQLGKLINESLKKSNARKPKEEEINLGRKFMMENFFDIRSFGAVMSLKKAPNCGQVRGPVQLSFSSSVDPIIPMDISITRMAVATEDEAIKQSGDNRTMGRKAIVPYGLYRCHGFVSAPLAQQTGFSQEDLDLLFEALTNMFDHDRSAARGEMAARKLVVFKHACRMGKAPAQALFERVTVELKDTSTPPRRYGDYAVTVDTAGLPAGVEVREVL